jgi:ABC-type Fe3+-hydroxamate transport system substrate-binding protein
MFTALRRARTTQLATAGAAAVVLLLSACGTTESSASSTDAAAETAPAAASGPVSVTDERGTVKLDAPATKVASLEWGLTENLLSLGVTPVGAADVKGYNQYDTVVPLPADTPDLGQRGTPSLDAISALDPDLIVVTTDTTDKVIGQLGKIAPVVAMKGSDGTDPIGYLRKTVNVLAAATGTQAKATELLAGFDAKVAAGKAALAAAGKTGALFTMADGWVQSGTVTVRMYTPDSFLGSIAAQLGLENQWTTGGDPDYGLATTDVEGLTKLTKADSTFLYVADITADSFVDTLGKNAIWKKLPFVAAGNVKAVEEGIWMFGGTQAGEAYIDTVVKNITGTALS